MVEPTSIASECDQLAKRIKLHAINEARVSDLTPISKASLFYDLSMWAKNLSERILLAIEMDEVAAYKSINDQH